MSDGADTRDVSEQDAAETPDPIIGRDGAGGSDDAPQTDPPVIDIDLQFASIVSHWDDETPRHPGEVRPPAPPGDQAAADVPAAAPVADPNPAGGGATPDRATGQEDDEALLGWRGYILAEVEDHFEPPPPALPPAHDATYWLAVAGLTLGPLIVIWAAVLSGNPDPGWWVLCGLVLTMAGFGLMVLRGSGERDPDDNGARV